MSPAQSHRIFVLIVLFASACQLISGTALACGEADFVALDLTEELLPDPSLAAQIDADLAAIRAFDPAMAEIEAWPDWHWGYLLAKMTPEAFGQVVMGTYTGLDSLNALYGAYTIDVDDAINHHVRINFTGCYDFDQLAQVYDPHPDLLWADPRRVYAGGISEDITAEAAGTYLFYRGSVDCPSGCLVKQYWRYVVTDGVVELDEHWGPSAVGDAPAALAAFTLGQNTPNPFNPSTVITYDLRAPGRARLEILDLAGRPVRVLVDKNIGDGSHSTPWDGRDAAGRRVASGSYFYRLTVDGLAQTRRLTLLK